MALFDKHFLPAYESLDKMERADPELVPHIRSTVVSYFTAMLGRAIAMMLDVVPEEARAEHTATVFGEVLPEIIKIAGFNVKKCSEDEIAAMMPKPKPGVN